MDISIFPSKLPQVPNRISIKNVSWVIYRVTLAGITMCQKKWRHAASWCHVQSKTWKQAAGCDIRKKVWCTRWMSTMHNVTSFTQSNGDITERSSFTDFFSFQSSCTQGLPKEQFVCRLISWMGLPNLPTTNANWTSLVPYTVKVTKLLRKCRMIVPPHEKLVKHDKNEWTDSRNINQNILQRVHHEARLMDSSCAKLTTRDRTPWKGTSLRDMFRAGLTLGICTTPHSLSWTNIRTPKALRTCRTPAAKTDALDCRRQESKGKAPVQHTGRVKKHIVSCSCIALKYARSGGNTVCSPYSTVSTHTCV